jgi:peptidoglycan/LPS O-acetylase OafA/YrhL
MLNLYTLLILAFILGLKIKKNADAEKFSKDDTAGLKGFAALLVLFHHLGQNSPLTGAFERINYSIGWIAVGLFFFFSFYGLTKGYLKEKSGYAKKIFLKKIPNLYLEIVVINVISFVVYYRDAGLPPFEAVVRILNLYIFFGFDMMTGYSWFITSIILLYVLFGLVLLLRRVFENRLWLLPILTVIAALVFVAVISVTSAVWWHYRAIWCVPLGVVYAVYDKKINGYLNRKSVYLLSLALAAGCLAFNYFYSPPINLFSREYINAVIVCVILVIALQKVDFGKNRLFTFLGEISLEIYLMQYFILSHIFATTIQRSFIILFACLAACIALAYLFHTAYFGTQKRIKFFISHNRELNRKRNGNREL